MMTVYIHFQQQWRVISSCSPDLKLNSPLPFNQVELERSTYFFKVFVTLTSDSKTLFCLKINNETCYDSSSNLADRGLCLRFYISKNLPDGTDDVGPRPTH